MFGQCRPGAEGAGSSSLGERPAGQVRVPPVGSLAKLCFPAVSEDRELVWLRATRSQHVSVTRITHQAAIRLGLAQSVTEAYQVRLRLSSEPRFVLRAEGSRRWSASGRGASGEAQEPSSRT